MSILYKDNYTLQKTKSYNKNCWSLIYNMNYGLKSRLHKSQIYKKRKKTTQSWASCCTAEFSGVIHSHPCPVSLCEVEDGCLKGSRKLSCTLLWR